MDIPRWLQKEFMKIMRCHRESPSWGGSRGRKMHWTNFRKNGKSAQNVFGHETGPDARSRAETRGKMIPGPARSLSDWCRGAPGPKNRCRASGLRKNYFRASPRLTPTITRYCWPNSIQIARSWYRVSHTSLRTRAQSCSST